MTLFYRNQLHNSQKLDKEIIRNLIHKYILPMNRNKWNPSITTKAKITANDGKKIKKLQQINLFYELAWPPGEYLFNNNNSNSTYIGYVIATLACWLSCHLSNNSSIKSHIITSKYNNEIDKYLTIMQ